MAKEQNLTLNSMKISGPCGRLLCCLSYEFDVYKEARQSLPAMGTRVQFEGEEFRVTELNVLARRVRIQSESGRVLDMGFDSLSRNPATQAWEMQGAGRAGNEKGSPPRRPCGSCATCPQSVTFCPARSRSSLPSIVGELSLRQRELADPVEEDRVEVAVVGGVVHARRFSRPPCSGRTSRSPRGCRAPSSPSRPPPAGR